MIPAVFWQDIEAAGGMYTGAEVLELINMRTGKHTIFSHLRQQAHLLSVKRGTAYIYPRFQFDPETHLIRPVIADLIKLADDAGWSQEELLVWLCSPSGHFVATGRPNTWTTPTTSSTRHDKRPRFDGEATLSDRVPDKF